MYPLLGNEDNPPKNSTPPPVLDFISSIIEKNKKIKYNII